MPVRSEDIKMIDPFTALSIAAGAVSNIQSLISAGRDATQAMSKFAGAYADINYAAEKAQNPPWWKFGGSAEEEAMNIFAAQKKVQQMKKDVETIIGYTYGHDGLEEYKETIRRVRKQRQETEYRRVEIKEAVILWSVGIAASICAVAILVAAVYFIGKARGNW
jgi:hypothetical protein